MDAEQVAPVKPSGMSNSLKAFLIVFFGTILVIFVTWLVFYLMSNKSRDDAKNPPSGLTPVPIDLPRYLGKWFEIARLPNKFEGDFDGNVCKFVTAEYSEKVGDADTINVKNTCTVRNGDVQPTSNTTSTTSNEGLVTTTTTTTGGAQLKAGTNISDGYAEVNSNGTLAVTFVPDPIPPFYGNYTVIYRQLGSTDDDPWQTSVVVGGTDKVEYAWILSRTPTMVATDLTLALAALTAVGVDVSKLVMTVQDA